MSIEAKLSTKATTPLTMASTTPTAVSPREKGVRSGFLPQSQPEAPKKAPEKAPISVERTPPRRAGAKTSGFAIARLKASDRCSIAPTFV